MPWFVLAERHEETQRVCDGTVVALRLLRIARHLRDGLLASVLL